MTVVPIPVAPTPAEPAVHDAGADTEAAPGFANLLDAAQGQDASESTGETGDASTNGGTQGESREKPANALTDATVMALLAALTGTAQPAAPIAPVAEVALDATAVAGGEEAEVVAAAEADIATATISLVDEGSLIETAGDPVVVTPAPTVEDAADPAAPSTPSSGETPVEGAPPAPAPATAERSEPSTTTPVVDTEVPAGPVTAAPVIPAEAEKPAPSNATAFTAATPPVVAPAEPRGAAPAAPAAPAAAPAPPVPTEQVVSVLRPLRRVADGSYELRLQLRPPELGQIELRVELRHGVLSATLHADNPQAVEVMRNGLGELRARLEAEGVRAGALTVDSNAAQMSQRDRESQRDARDGGDPFGVPADTVAISALPATDADALLDVRI